MFSCHIEHIRTLLIDSVTPGSSIFDMKFCKSILLLSRRTFSKKGRLTRSGLSSSWLERLSRLSRFRSAPYVWEQSVKIETGLYWTRLSKNERRDDMEATVIRAAQGRSSWWDCEPCKYPCRGRSSCSRRNCWGYAWNQPGCTGCQVAADLAPNCGYAIVVAAVGLTSVEADDCCWSSTATSGPKQPLATGAIVVILKRDKNTLNNVESWTIKDCDYENEHV